MTEDEAKTKWCPFAAGVITENPIPKGRVMAMAGGVNRTIGALVDNADAAPLNCLASDCMAWRWITEPPTRERPTYERSTTEGRCGLAGSL